VAQSSFFSNLFFLYILADAKRRRTKKEIKDEKLKEEVKKAEIAVKLQEHQAMQNRIRDLQA